MLARDLAARSLGPATAKYREIGTVANVSFFNRMGLLPIRNFGSGHFAGADALSGETLRLEHYTGQHACAACSVGCEHHYRTRDGGPETSARLEYETLFALGSLCGVSDPNAVLRASALCDDLGMDAISAGGTVAWAMECGERGIDLGVAENEIPRWGDGAALLRTLQQIGMREGLGDLLAEGSRGAAAAAAAEDQAALLDSLTLCKFLRHALGDVHEESAALHRAVTGLPTTADELHAAGARIGEVKKRFNLAQGWTRALDTLPPRLLTSDGEGPHIDPAWLERQIDAYYAVRGWDADGQPRVPD